jgi:hypothetical protein
VFTSYYDDSFGGDSNGDAGLIPPTLGRFAGIEIFSGGFLEASGFTIRYAGHTGFEGDNSGGVEVLGGSVNISNALFSQNYSHGIFSLNSPGLGISNTRFENHTTTAPYGTKAALAVYNTTAALSNLIFENNLLGIIADGSTFTVEPAGSITWIGNTATTSPQGLF